MYTLMTTNETSLSRSLPYCAFQHYLATILNATIIKRSIVCNVEQRFINEVDPFEVTMRASNRNAHKKRISLSDIAVRELRLDLSLDLSLDSWFFFNIGKRELKIKAG